MSVGLDGEWVDGFVLGLIGHMDEHRKALGIKPRVPNGGDSIKMLERGKGKIFIAGATGVLGRRLVRQFTEKGYAVLGLVRDDRGEEIVRSGGGLPCRASLFDVDSLVRAGEGADIVIHAATAIPRKPGIRLKDWEMNDRIRREGTRALVQAAVKVGAQQFIFQSITWIARPPDGSPYHEDSPVYPDLITQSAWDGEQIVRETGKHNDLSVSILRCGWFNSADSVHTREIGRLISKRMLPIIGKGEAEISIIHAEDAARAFVAVAEAGKSGLWHVVDNQPVAIRDFYGGFAERLHAPPPWHVPPWLARIVAGKLVVDMLTIPSRTSNRKFREEIGWSPRYPTHREMLDQIVGEWRREGFL